jgi:CBS-domain-containing membrane protein
VTWTVSDVMSKNVAGLGAAGELMTGDDVVTTTAGTPLATAASLMFQHRLKVLPVVDSENRLVGIVSRARLLRVFLRSDETIRKEIARDYLRDSSLIDCGKVEAEVTDGVVHLFGEVETGCSTGLLMRSVAGVPGVVGVQSDLKFTKFDLAGLTESACQDVRP